MDEISILRACRSFASAIILKAFEDYKLALKGIEHDDYNLEELEEFFNSEWFEELCEIVQINPNAMREKLNKIKKLIGADIHEKQCQRNQI